MKFSQCILEIDNWILKKNIWKISELCKLVDMGSSGAVWSKTIFWAGLLNGVHSSQFFVIA